MELQTRLDTFPGVGEKRGKSLVKLGLETVEDLLQNYPRTYEDRRAIYSITQAPVGEAVCIRGMVARGFTTNRIRQGLTVTKGQIVDATGQLELVFFNQDYVRNALAPGEEFIFYGKVESFGRRRSMNNPAFERGEQPRFTGRIMPIYPLTAGISNNLLAGLALRCVERCAGQLPEELPPGLREEHCLCTAEYACRNLHFPADEEALAVARRRAVFEELFTLSCGLALLRARRTVEPGRPFPARQVEDYLSLLPFSPTGAQQRAMEELRADLTGDKPMNRLVQGDVGSGKTAVAAFAAWLCHGAGAQSAMMAPTEILARQHYATLSTLLSPAGIRVGLLVGSLKASEKRGVQKALAAGEIDLVVGTHALLSAGVEFRDLGLVITDEQHRFGVGQRSALSSKAVIPPHVLVMSATPIPRTLALLIYGDLDVSIIDELPPGRQPVETYLVSESKRERMYGFVRKQVTAGRQVYIICPAVEGEEDDGVKSVKAYAQELSQKIFPDLRVGLVHGKLKGKEKEAVMADFAAGAVDILVSTTVVEVGVDVPNANLMVIENADRFGLSQLHQLRGRVGRGQWQSYCVLVSGNRNPDTRERLRYFCSTTDGFKIAEKDLELRGPGDFFGQRQHGLPALRSADLATDTRTLKEAQEAAKTLLAQDPTLAHPIHAPLREKIRRLFSEEGNVFN